MLQVIQNGAAQASDAKDQLPIWHQVASAEKSELLSSFRSGKVYLQHQKHNKKNLIYPTTLQHNSIGALALKLEGYFYTRGIRLMCFKHSANLLSLVFQMQRKMAPKDNFRRDGLFSFHVQFISENLRQTGLHINEVVLSTEFKM